MKQLVFNDKFDKIIDEPIKYWKSINDIPKEINEFINKNSMESSFKTNFHCPLCGHLLKKNFYCYYCYADVLNYYTDRNFYYVFDIVDNEVILYIISEFKKFQEIQEHRCGSLTIEKAYHVKSCGITDLIDDKYYDFTSFNKNIDFEKSIQEYNRYLYTDNFNDLKDSIYRYTYIWSTTDYIKDDFTIKKLVYIPLYFPQFEYLVKYKLYNLAYNTPNLLTGRKFTEIFGVGKQYLSFMQDIDINYDQLKALQLCKEKDLSLIEFTIKYATKLKSIIKRANITVKDIKDYFDKNDLDYYDISEYDDYLRFACQLHLDLKNKKILFPKYLFVEHYTLSQEVNVINNPKINDSIKSLSNILQFNCYDDGKYIIFPATSVESMIDEGEQQQNCLRTYCESYSNNECQIYLMRKKDNILKSFVTIEVNDSKVLQARTRFNKLPSDEIMKILKKWEKTLIPIVNESSNIKQ